MIAGKREAIDVALLAQLNGMIAKNLPIAPYTLAAQGTRHPYNVQQTPPANKPTFYLCKYAEAPDQKEAIGLTKNVLYWKAIFFLTIDPTDPTAPASAANAILDAVDAAIQTVPPGERQTLGGLVNNVWIGGGGTTWIIGGISDQTMEIEVPIKAELGN